MLLGMKLSLRQPQAQPFLVIAVDPEAEARCVEVPVDAISADEARRAARRELAKTKRDHWMLTAERAA